MKKSTIRNSACAAALLLGIAGSAGACEMYRDGVLGVWRGNCKLTIDPKAPQIAQPFIEGMSRPILFKLPDLTIRKFKFYLLGQSLEVYADVTNAGDQSSIATNIGLTVTTLDPANVNPSVVNTLPVAAVPAIPAMTTRRIYVGTVFVNNTAQDVDVVTSGMVDQVTVAQPIRGTVIESNETNNSLIDMCRVFGPAPVLGPPGCN